MSFDDGWEERERGDDALAAEVRRETLAGLDLNDPEVENYVAAAIVRLAPEGAYVPLSMRYPWRFSEPTAGRQRSDLLQPLLRLAALLDEGVLVPGPPPGPCPSRLTLTLVRADGAGGVEHLPEGHVCTLLATHAGLHTDGQAIWPDQPDEALS
jgi:hypothetical protein